MIYQPLPPIYKLAWEVPGSWLIIVRDDLFAGGCRVNPYWRGNPADDR